MSKTTVLAPGEGDKWFIVGDHGTNKLRGEQTGGRYGVALTYTVPQAGPPPHLHTREDEMFYVLSGRMMFMDNQHTFIAGPGTVVYLKRNVPHTFKNVGDEIVQCILTTFPSGFEKFVDECGTKIDKVPCDLKVDDAAIGKLMANCGKYGIQILPEHKVLGEKQHTPKSRKLWVLGQLVDIKLTSADTDGNFSVVEVTAQPGQLVPPHTHIEMDEYFHIIEGEFEFTLEGKPVNAPAGTFIHVPRGVSHGFANKTGKPAKLADFHTPGGFEKFFEECGTVCTDPAASPAPKAVDVAAMAKLFQKHGMTLG